MSATLVSSLLILVGLIGLVVGGELLVRGAAALAGAARISPLVIGLTVVAFGTSAPELAVTIQAAWAGAPEIAVGNVVGSNIANVLLILGLSALVAPLVVQSRVVRIDVPLMIACSVGLWLLVLDGAVSRLDGLLLFATLIGYVIWSVIQGRREGVEIQDEFAAALPHDGSTAPYILRQTGLVVGGLVLLVIAARLLVSGGSDIARQLGVSELVIGLTIVAVGTSLPELVTSVVASLRGQRDIAVGNVVGSNLFNILAVLGLGALVAPGGIPVADQVLRLDLPIMIATAAACLPVFFTGGRINRPEGALFFFYYVAYTTYVVMGATGAAHMRSFELGMLGFVIPLTVMAIAVSVYQHVSIQRRQP
ncbi:MAG: calcium/sodium antiporter [Bdellovibrio bacteriovorus]